MTVAGWSVVALSAVTREGWSLIGLVMLAAAGVAVTVAGAILLIRQRRR